MKTKNEYRLKKILFPTFVPGCTFMEKVGALLVYYMLLPCCIILHVLGMKIKV